MAIFLRMLVKYWHQLTTGKLKYNTITQVKDKHLFQGTMEVYGL